MKIPKPKTNTTSDSHSSKPFFSKNRSSGFKHEESEKPFFSPSPFIQRKGEKGGQEDEIQKKDEELSDSSKSEEELNKEAELLFRTSSAYNGLGSDNGGRPGSTKVTPEVAIKILDNLSKGEHAFKPEFGKAGASWFVTEGNPYVGISTDKSISVQVEITGLEKGAKFNEAILVDMFDKTKAEVAVEAKAEYLAKKGLPKDHVFNSKLKKSFARFLDRYAETKMWDKVGQQVANSSSKVGEVILEPGSRFSKTPGKFAVVSDASKIQLKGGAGALAKTLTVAGKGADPTVSAAAKEWARTKNVGRVQGVFRIGGRILIVVGIAADAYRIYRAEDRLKETVSVAGGWTGAGLFAAAFATWYAPADVAGPIAWIGHGVGTLVAGGIGYFVGSESTQYLYELVVEE